MLKPQFDEGNVQYFKQFWKEIDLSKADLEDVKSDILAYIDEIDSLQQQNKQLIACVEWYGDIMNHVGPGGLGSKMQADRGKRAQEVIESLQGGTSNGTS